MGRAPPPSPRLPRRRRARKSQPQVPQAGRRLFQEPQPESHGAAEMRDPNMPVSADQTATLPLCRLSLWEKRAHEATARERVAVRTIGRARLLPSRSIVVQAFQPALVRCEAWKAFTTMPGSAGTSPSRKLVALLLM